MVIGDQSDPRAAIVEVAGEALDQGRLPRPEESADHDVLGWHGGKVNELGRSFKGALLIEDYGSTVLRGCRPDLPRQRLYPLSSDLDDALTLIHRAAAGALGEVEIGKIFEDVIADSADDEILAPLIFPPFAKDLGRDPGEEEGAKDAD